MVVVAGCAMPAMPFPAQPSPLLCTRAPPRARLPPSPSHSLRPSSKPPLPDVRPPTHTPHATHIQVVVRKEAELRSLESSRQALVHRADELVLARDGLTAQLSDLGRRMQVGSGCGVAGGCLGGADELVLARDGLTAQLSDLGRRMQVGSGCGGAGARGRAAGAGSRPVVFVCVAVCAQRVSLWAIWGSLSHVGWAAATCLHTSLGLTPPPPSHVFHAVLFPTSQDVQQAVVQKDDELSAARSETQRISTELATTADRLQAAETQRGKLEKALEAALAEAAAAKEERGRAAQEAERRGVELRAAEATAAALVQQRDALQGRLRGLEDKMPVGGWEDGWEGAGS